MRARFLSRCAFLLGVVLANASGAEPTQRSAPQPLLDVGQTELSAQAGELADELRQRALALALPVVALAAGVPERQTSPRYAAFDRRELQATLFASVWVFSQPTPEERASLDAAAQLLAQGPESQLGRALVARNLATHVDARVEEHAGVFVFSVYVESTPAARLVDLTEVVQRAVVNLSSAGPSPSALERMNRISGTEAVPVLEPSAIRRVAARYLVQSRQTVVEFIPRNAVDPAVVALGRGTAREAGRGAKSAAAKKGRATRAHSVRRGDTLIGIARRYKTSVRALVRANGIDPKRPIRLGQKLIIEK